MAADRTWVDRRSRTPAGLLPPEGTSAAGRTSPASGSFVAALICAISRPAVQLRQEESMIRSSLVKSACVAIGLLGLSAPHAGAIQLQGSNPSAQLSEGVISKAFVAHRGVTAVGPRGGVYHRGGTAVGGYRGGAYRGGVYRGGVYRGGAYGGVYRGGYGGWARPGWYHWGPGGAIAAGAAVGVLAAGAAAVYAGSPPAPGLCWYYTDPSYRQGFWDACQ